MTTNADQNQTMTASPAAYLTLEQAANTYSCSTRSLLRASERRLIKLTRPFGSGGKIYLASADLDLFFRNGFKTPPDFTRGERLSISRKHTKVKR